jgi:cytochrome c-type biogenesis protein CcmE
MKKGYLIGIILIAIAFAAIITTVSGSGTYADFATAQMQEGKVFHVVGKLDKNKPYEYNPEANANIFGFYMIDNTGAEHKVLLNKTKPQDFEKSEQIVIIGKMKDDVFIASDILMKCPSKYNSNEVQTKTS